MSGFPRIFIPQMTVSSSSMDVRTQPYNIQCACSTAKAAYAHWTKQDLRWPYWPPLLATKFLVTARCKLRGRRAALACSYSECSDRHTTYVFSFSAILLYPYIPIVCVPYFAGRRTYSVAWAVIDKRSAQGIAYDSCAIPASETLWARHK